MVLVAGVENLEDTREVERTTEEKLADILAAGRRPDPDREFEEYLLWLPCRFLAASAAPPVPSRGPGQAYSTCKRNLPGKWRGAAAQQLMTVGPCDCGTAGAIVEPSLSLEGLGMTNPTCRNCDRSADTGAYCSSCAAGIMASALNPHFRSRRKRLPIKQRALPQRPGPTAGDTSGQQRLFR